MAEYTIHQQFCLTYKGNGQYPYYFVGKTEEEALERFNEWKKSYKAPVIEPTVTVTKIKQETNVEPDAIPSEIYEVRNGEAKGQGRGAALIDTVWMINHKTQVRKRVPGSEKAAYEALGWVQGGPRTAFK